MLIYSGPYCSRLSSLGCYAAPYFITLFLFGPVNQDIAHGYPVKVQPDSCQPKSLVDSPTAYENVPLPDFEDSLGNSATEPRVPTVNPNGIMMEG